MKIINTTKNTIYADDIDQYFPYEEGKIEDIDPDLLKKSHALRGFILCGMFEVLEYDENERIENSLMYLKKNLPASPKEEVTEPVKLETCSNEIELKIHGIFWDASGYGKVNRNIAARLSEMGFKVKVDAKRSQNQLNEDELAPIVKLQKNQISKNHILIDSIVPSFAEISTGKHRILYSTIESYTVPKQFTDCCELYDEIWLTSDFSASILRKYTKKPIYVMTTGADPELYNEEGSRFDFRPNINSFVFISVFGWNYRKGYDVLLRSYFDEFSSDDDVSLLIMSRYQSGQTKFHRNKIKNDIDEIMKEFPNKDLPHVVRYSNTLAEKDMPKIYRSAHCFILPSRGEGGCTKSGTKIITDEGLCEIETIGCGTKILTHKGRWKQVTSTRNRYTEEPIYEISSTLNEDIISLTGEHPCLVLPRQMTMRADKKDKAKFIPENCEWLTPTEINIGDYLVMPLNFGQQNPNIFLMECDTTRYLNNVIIKNDKIYSKGRNRSGTEFQHPLSRPISTALPLHKDFLQFLGFYISEGCSKTSTGQITFSFHSSEIEYHDIVTNVLQKYFQLSAIVLSSTDDRKYRHVISCNNVLLNTMLANMCGRGSHNKHLPDFTWKMNNNQIKHLLYGVFCGDGSFYNPKSSPSLSLSTVSQQLADEVVLALRMVGISPCKQNKKRRGYVVSIKGNQLNELNEIKGACFSGDIKERSVRTTTHTYLPIKKITQKEFAGYVYNLEVQDDNSYTTNCFTVHNCLPPLEASLCGLPVIMTNCSGQQGYLRADNSYMIDIDRLMKVDRGQFNIHYWDGQKFPSLKSAEVHKQVKSTMRKVMENYDEAKKKNNNLQQLILQKFTWNNTANNIASRLKEIHTTLRG